MRKTPIVIIALSVAVAVAMALLIREPDTVPYHLDRLVHLRSPARKMPPSDFRGYFRRETLSWYLRGRPSLETQIEGETGALIRLGYFGQREFTLRHRLLDRRFTDQLKAACATDPFVRTNYRAMSYDKSAGIVCVTTRKDCMPVLESIIIELDRKAD